MEKLDISEEMKKIISERLPEATAGAMYDFIAEAEKTKNNLVEAEDIIKIQVHKLSNKVEEITKYKRMVSEIETYIKRDKDVSIEAEKLRIRERDLKLEIVQIKLAAADDRNDKIESLVEKVFGHPSVSVSTYRDKPIMVDPGGGGFPYQNGIMNENESKTTTHCKT